MYHERRPIFPKVTSFLSAGFSRSLFVSLVAAVVVSPLLDVLAMAVPGSVKVSAYQCMQHHRLSVSTALYQLCRLRLGLRGSCLPPLCALLGNNWSIRAVSWSCTDFIYPGSAFLVSDGPVLCVFNCRVIDVPESG